MIYRKTQAQCSVFNALFFFRRHGVDLTLVQVRSGPIGIAALSSGESQLNWGSVSAANLGAIAEGADLVFVARFLAWVRESRPRLFLPCC